MEKIRVGITTGDLNGIGLEVVLKTLANPKITDLCTPILYGSPKVVAYHKNPLELDIQFSTVQSADDIEQEDKIYVVNCWQDNANISLGKITEEGGAFAFRSLERAVEDLKSGTIDALVTAPIHKKSMQMIGFPFPGHTEYITEKTEAKESLMFMVSDDFRIGLVTNHLPLSQVATAVTQEKIVEKLKIMHKTLKIDFFIEKPTIAVLGLNPHAGDEGALGEEEATIIRPAVEAAKAAGIMAMGPFSADGFFGAGQHRKFDGVLAMYHDQGLVAFKSLSFGDGVNFTAGLPVVRTSPDHGTGFDIAGMNKANPDSFRKALYLAIDIARNREEFAEMSANPLVYQRSRKKMKAQADDYSE